MASSSRNFDWKASRQFCTGTAAAIAVADVKTNRLINKKGFDLIFLVDGCCSEATLRPFY